MCAHGSVSTIAIFNQLAHEIQRSFWVVCFFQGLVSTVQRCVALPSIFLESTHFGRWNEIGPVSPQRLQCISEFLTIEKKSKYVYAYWGEGRSAMSPTHELVARTLIAANICRQYLNRISTLKRVLVSTCNNQKYKYSFGTYLNRWRVRGCGWRYCVAVRLQTRWGCWCRVRWARLDLWTWSDPHGWSIRSIESNRRQNIRSR